MLNLIEKKKNKKELSDSDIKYLVDMVTKGQYADYQLAALLMAIRLNGMTTHETTCLTYEMAHSGQIADLSGIKGIVCDKHSSGGVSDSVTMVAAPLMAACGLKVAKLSGRGLGFTGGTIDKLEGFEGFNTALDTQDFIAQVNDLGIAIAAQTQALAPCDKYLYALRDVTGTVDSIPLIASSIMSKKIAAGAQIIVLDVKYGSGAFMKTAQQAQQLAQIMVKIGQNLGKKTCAFVSSMQQPLGEYIGCNLEVNEAIHVLEGKKGALYELSLSIVQRALSMAGLQDTAQQKLHEGKALEVFKQLVHAQGASFVSRLKVADKQMEVCATKSGYVSKINAAALGNLNIALGGGRKQKDEPIDHTVGLHILARLGDYVRKGQRIATVFYNKQVQGIASELQKAIHISPRAPVPIDTVFAIID